MGKPFEIPRNLGKYTLGDPIARGGMGFVYRGTDRLVGRAVAIKFLRPELIAASPEKRKRFALEAKTAARLVHPNLVTIYDVGEYREIPYLVTQFVGGASLRELCDDRDLDEGARLDVFCDLAMALEVCHEAGIVHRDIKPSNVRMSTDGRAVLLDFGIAKVGSQPEITRAGVIIGSAPYMAPEQARGDTVDGRADLFSLGAMMYQVYSGRKPFDGPNRREVILERQRLREEDLPPSLLKDDVPEEIDWIVRRLLAPKPEARYPSARALRGDLEALRQALSATGARAGERLSLRQQLAPGARPPWVAPLLCSAALLFGGLVLLGTTGPSRSARPGPDGGTQPTGPTAADPRYADVVRDLAEGRLDLAGGRARLAALGPPTDAWSRAVAESVLAAEAAAARAAGSPRAAYEELIAVARRAPAPVARAVRRHATALRDARGAFLRELERAFKLALDGRPALARATLDRIRSRATKAERAGLESLQRATGWLDDGMAHLAGGEPGRAREALLAIAGLPIPDAAARLAPALARLDGWLARQVARAERRLAQAGLALAAGDRTRARALLDGIPPEAVDEGALAALRSRLATGGSAPASDYKTWHATARRTLARGDFERLRGQLKGALARFRGTPGAADAIEGLNRQLATDERDAVMTYTRFLRHVLADQSTAAQSLLGQLRTRYPDSDWTRKAQRQWERRR